MRTSETPGATHPSSGLALLLLELCNEVYNRILDGDVQKISIAHIILTREGRISIDNVKTMINLMAVNCWHRNNVGA